MKLKSEVAIVTGGGGSMGRAIALRFAREGAIPIICDVDADRAAAVAAEIAAAGGQALALETNLLSANDIAQMTEQVIRQFGRVDILVNCAGGSARSRSALLQYVHEDVIDDILGVNLRAALLCARAVIGQMIEQGRGNVVNIASIVGLQGKVRHSEYAAAKAGVIAMTKSLAIEVGPSGIRVNCVSPGLVPRGEVKGDGLLRTNVLGKIGKPEGIANMVTFLVSDEADFITGQNFVVDGGRSLGLRGDHQ